MCHNLSSPEINRTRKWSVSMDTKEPNSLKVLMIPWLAHGHISPFLELAKKLSNRDFSVYFCSTPIILTSIKERHAEKNYSLSLKIHLVELHLPSLPELPPHRHTTNGLPSHLKPTLVQAFEMASPSFSTILKTINPNLIIFDILQPWVPSLASSHNIPAVHFQTCGAAATSFFYRLYKHRGIGNSPFQAIYLKESEMKRMMTSPTAESSTTGGFSDKDRAFSGIERSCDMVLIKSSREIEGKYIDFLSGLIKKKIVSVGPLVEEGEEDSKILEWLSKKEQSSCVFVSFGSECYLSEEEMEEIAHGLELSGVNFIWVIRFPVGENFRIEEALPEGFLERVKERSVIVEGWAPQAGILKHSSIGGFLSHCGWSSVVESMSFGVPIIAMPMQFDQPLNARLLLEAGVGLEVMRDENWKIKREEVAEVIKEVVVKKSGEDIRRKARELSENIKIREEEGGDYLVEELSKLCEKNNQQ